MIGGRITGVAAAFCLCGVLSAWSQELTPSEQTMAERRRLAGEGQTLICYPVKAITSRRILPDAAPPSKPVSRILLRACPGEYEPASFVVVPLDQDVKVTVGTSELTGENGVMPRETVDIRSVKRWYQSGIKNIVNEGKRILTPELLLYDDSLIRVDHETRDNYVRLRFPDGREEWRCVSDAKARFEQEELERWTTETCPIQDAQTLQPVRIPRQHAKQFWITIHVPAEAKAGSYTGTITVAPETGRSEKIELAVQVLPFKLDPNPLDSSIYYKWRDQLDPTAMGTVTAWTRSKAQIRWELKNLMAHGVDNPTVGAGPKNLPTILSLRAEAGMRSDRLYHLTKNINTTSPEEMQEIMDIARKFGFSEIYFYMQDEATGEKLAKQRPLIERAHEMGAKVFVAGRQNNNFPALGDIQDVFVCAGAPSRREAGLWHSKGHKIFCYANPQAGVEDPEVYRRNYGLLLAMNGYDGAMTYIYCQAWNDFCRKWRAHNFVYPTADGGIDTIQWEGYREAMDDLRYLATLRKAIAEASRGNEVPRIEAAKARSFMRELDIRGDLEEVRDAMIERIITLAGEEPSQRTAGGPWTHGLTYLKNDAPAGARRAFRKLVAEYPGTDYAKKAAEKLKELEGH